jgi:hypothetical protein
MSNNKIVKKTKHFNPIDDFDNKIEETCPDHQQKSYSDQNQNFTFNTKPKRESSCKYCYWFSLFLIFCVAAVLCSLPAYSLYIYNKNKNIIKCYNQVENDGYRDYILDLCEDLYDKYYDLSDGQDNSSDIYNLSGINCNEFNITYNNKDVNDTNNETEIICKSESCDNIIKPYLGCNITMLLVISFFFLLVIRFACICLDPDEHSRYAKARRLEAFDEKTFEKAKNELFCFSKEWLMVLFCLGAPITIFITGMVLFAEYMKFDLVEPYDFRVMIETHFWLQIGIISTILSFFLFLCVYFSLAGTEYCRQNCNEGICCESYRIIRKIDGVYKTIGTGCQFCCCKDTNDENETENEAKTEVKNKVKPKKENEKEEIRKCNGGECCETHHNIRKVNGVYRTVGTEIKCRYDTEPKNDSDNETNENSESN